jgi:hypothetical protein
VRNRGQARSRDTMRVDENWERMRYLYYSTGGTIYRGGGPPRAGGQGERRLGGGSIRRLGLRLPKP